MATPSALFLAYETQEEIAKHPFADVYWGNKSYGATSLNGNEY